MDIQATITWLSANVAVSTAIITAGVSAIVSLIALFANPFLSGRIERLRGELNRSLEQAKAEAQRNLEKHKSDLSDDNAERNAKRDYEYEARKRLYGYVEPLMFQLSEAAEAAQLRVESLCRTSRQGDLGPDGWLSKPSYYLRSTLYRLLLPASILRLLQRRMTFVDMQLDRGYARTYSLLKLYTLIFTDDYRVASLTPSAPYRPNETGVRDPQHRKQGMYMGHLEILMDLMIVKEAELLRPCTFGEFNSLFDHHIDADHFRSIIMLFTAFRPQEDMILARILHLLGICAHSIVHSVSDTTNLSAMGLVARNTKNDETALAYVWSEGSAANLTSYEGYFSRLLTKAIRG